MLEFSQFSAKIMNMLYVHDIIKTEKKIASLPANNSAKQKKLNPDI